MDEYFRVKGHDNIYAIGDITDVKEEKMAYLAKYHAEKVVKTLKGKSTPYKSKCKFYSRQTLGLCCRILCDDFQIF